MILQKNKHYVKGSDVPMKHFRYILVFEAKDMHKIYKEPIRFRILKEEVPEWCNLQYGKILYTWMLGTSDIHLHSEEDAMAFKLRWA